MTWKLKDKNLGLIIINHNQLKEIKIQAYLLEPHGEPPETYDLLLKNNLKLIDASCPVVLKLQNQIKNGYNEIKEIDGQVVIYGKKGHAEVTETSDKQMEMQLLLKA